MKNNEIMMILGILLPLLSWGQSTNKNYVQSTVYTQESLNTNVSQGKLDQITYFDGLGRPIQSIANRAGGGEITPNNTMTYDWVVGNSGTNFYNINGAPAENLIENGTTPFGATDLLWKCGNDAASDADGGWNTDYFKIDTSKTYRYTVWVKRTGSASGYAYHGTQNVNNLDGTNNANPYFWSGTLPQADTWYLMVGVVHPHTYSSTTDSGEAGIYDSSGNKVLDGTEFKWQSTNDVTRFRNYLYYSTDVNVRQYFYKPLLQVKDGSEWQLEDLLSNSQAKDIVTHMEYDAIGRQHKEFLPYASATNSLGFQANAGIITNQYYQAHFPQELDATPNPYSEQQFEASPLSRVLQQAAPGKDWSLTSNHTIKFEHVHNVVADSVKNYGVEMVNNDYTKPSLVYNGLYATNTLYKSITKDENWKPTDGKNHTTEEFKDKQGRVLLKRTYENDIYHDTQYVYDQYGNLSYVMSPKGSDLVMTQYNYQFWGKSVLPSVLIPSNQSATGTGSISLSINPTTKKFTLIANVSFSATIPLETGAIIQINQNVPDTELGVIGSYKFVLEDGYLKMYSTSRTITPVNSLSGTLTADLEEYSIHQNQLDALCYQYVYDARNRLIEKKIPQKAWEFIIYNKLNQPIMTQDQKLRGQNKWLFTKYDAFNRPVYTGIYTHSAGVTRDAMQLLANNNSTVIEAKTTAMNYNGTTVYYTNSAFPNTAAALEVLTINYYDDYSFDTVLTPQTGSIYGEPISAATKSLTTGTKVRVLDTNDWISTLMHYDKKGQVIYTASHNPYIQTTDKIKSKYDFVGNVLETEATHEKGTNAAIVVRDVYTYDHQNRLLTQVQTINGQNPEVIVSNGYDEFGTLKNKKVGGGTLSDDYTDNVGLIVTPLANGEQQIKKETGVNNWTAGLRTVDQISGDGQVSFTLTHADKYLMAGLAVPNNQVSYSSINYALDIMANGTVGVYESGNNRGVKTTAVDGDHFVVERIGTTVHYKKNGTTFYTSGVAATGPLVGDASFYSVGATISALKVGKPLNDGLQTIDYTYNIRGWLTRINDVNNLNDDLFGFTINYNKVAEGTAANEALYNGNISQTIWKTASDAVKRGYAYTYDDLNRIRDARFRKGTNLDTDAGHFEMYDVNYDKNGNILKLKRNAIAGVQIDHLDYSYSGNQLTKVSDLVTNTEGFNDGNTVGDDYSYDQEGNMLFDKNKNITSINYNHLNLPRQIEFGTGGADGKIAYIYDALGGKIAKKVETTGTGGGLTVTSYAGNFNYKNDDLQFISHPEGYVEDTQDASKPFVYFYQYKDHLGNIRLSFRDTDGDGHIDVKRGTVDVDGDGDYENEIVEEHNYYPYGLKHKGYNEVVTERSHKYRYNGKEFQDELGLDWSDYGARNYDASLGRWMNIDPLAEKYYSYSTYTYTLDNPVYFIDPNGEEVDVTNLVNGGTNEDTWLLINVMADLSETSGRKISVVDNSDGTSTLEAGEINSEERANSEAGQYIMHLLDNSSRHFDPITIHRTDGANEGDIKGNVYLNAEQIYGSQLAIKKAGLDDRATNTGFTFLHETLHTKYGAFYYIKKGMYLNKLDHNQVFRDPREDKRDSETGTVVDIINGYRNSMQLPIRYIYGSTPGTLYFESKGEKHVIESQDTNVPQVKN